MYMLPTDANYAATRFILAYHVKTFSEYKM